MDGVQDSTHVPVALLLPNTVVAWPFHDDIVTAPFVLDDGIVIHNQNNG